MRLLDSLNEAALARVSSGEADFGIAPQRPTPPELVQAKLSRDRFDLICAPGHPLAARPLVTWRQVLRFPFIGLTRDFTARLQLDLAASSSALVLQPAHEVSYLTTALGLVRYGHGVTAQPSSAAPIVAAFGLLAVPIHAPVVHRQISIFTRRGQSLSPAATSLRGFIAEFVALRSPA